MLKIGWHQTLRAAAGPEPSRPAAAPSTGGASKEFDFRPLTPPTSPEQSGEVEDVSVSKKVGGRVLGEDGRRRALAGPIPITSSQKMLTPYIAILMNDLRFRPRGNADGNFRPVTLLLIPGPLKSKMKTMKREYDLVLKI
jgi:hypothetical protein